MGNPINPVDFVIAVTTKQGATREIPVTFPDADAAEQFFGLLESMPSDAIMTHRLGESLLILDLDEIAVLTISPDTKPAKRVAHVRV